MLRFSTSFEVFGVLITRYWKEVQAKSTFIGAQNESGGNRLIESWKESRGQLIKMEVCKTCYTAQVNTRTS